MPSYPDSVKTFTSKTSGQNIDPAHVNDLQDEVNAIEAGLLNGTARLNSSGSTLARLQVTGGSTFAGGLQSSNSTITGGLNSSNSTLANLSVTGGSTFASGLQSSNSTISGGLNSSNSTLANLSVTGGSTLGTLQGGASTVTSLSVSGGSTVTTLQAAGSTFSVRPVEPPPDAVRLTISSSLALASGVSTAINWLTQEYAINSSMHSTATTSSRVTPQSTGVYVATLQVGFTINSSGYRQVEIRDSSGVAVAVVRQMTVTTADNTYLQTVGTKRFDVTGGFLTAVLTQGNASTLSVPNDVNTWFEVRKL